MYCTFRARYVIIFRKTKFVDNYFSPLLSNIIYEYGFNPTRLIVISSPIVVHAFRTNLPNLTFLGGAFDENLKKKKNRQQNLYVHRSRYFALS